MAASRRAIRVGALAALMTVAVAGAARAQSGQNVLLIVNAQSDASARIADYYASRRGVPADQVLRLNLPVDEEISRPVYQAQIEQPIGGWLTTHAAQDRILYLVLTKDVPLRIAGTSGQQGTIASVDSELTLLYRRLTGGLTPATGSIPNPFFAAGTGLEKARPFSHRTHDIYLVARLDGYTVADVTAMIDRGLAPSRDGLVLLDGRLEVLPSIGNRWLAGAADALGRVEGWSERVRHDSGSTVLRDSPNVLGYYSWGSNDRTDGTRHLGHQFNPGALAAQFVSTDARTFREPPDQWTVNGNPFRGSHQSLIGDLIRDGITGVAGHVAEPYLNATIRPDVLFPAYVSGFNLVESFYLALPVLSWQTVVIGDPLCAPFRTTDVPADELNPSVDATSELPAFLSERRVARLVAAGATPEAALWMARAEVRMGRQDQAGGREALERATSIDEGLVAGHLLLGMLYERTESWDAAIDRYRRIVAQSPDHLIALNNLAYTLAVRRNSPAEALPFAVRGFASGKGGPAAADTLAWVYHLLGRDEEAEPLIDAAARSVPQNAEIQLHAAAILLARGKKDAAVSALDRALALDATLADHPDVQALRTQIR